MKNYIIVAAITSILLVPALFANTTGTGTTGTGTTGTGTTGTGTTGTGVSCNTGSVQPNQAALLAAQVAFSTEIARLLTVKQSAYTTALTLTGSAQIDVMRSANQAFRTGFKSAIRTLQAVRQSNGADRHEFRQCKKEEKHENRGRGKNKGHGDEHRSTENNGNTMSHGRGQDDNNDDRRTTLTPSTTPQTAITHSDDNNNDDRGQGRGRGGRR